MMVPERFIAKFTGQNGSMGLIRGKLYKVAFWPEKSHYVLYVESTNVRCPYQSLVAFLNNWYVYKYQ